MDIDNLFPTYESLLNQARTSVDECKEIEPERMKLLWLYLLENIKENLKFTFLVYSNEVGHNVGTYFNASGITSFEPDKSEITFTGDMLVSLKKTAKAKFTYNYNSKAFYQYKWVNGRKKQLPVICPTEGPNNQTNVSLMDKISEYTEEFMKENDKRAFLLEKLKEQEAELAKEQ